MKLALPKFFLLLATAAAVLSTGCMKKPVRPDPSITQMGGQNGPDTRGGMLNPENLTTNAPDGLTDRAANFGADGTWRGQLESVYFDLDRFDIKQPERVKLEAAKEYLEKNPQYRLLLEGHCDWRGTSEYNLGLGDRRANAAKAYLVKLGVPADKLETLSKGSEVAAKNVDETGMAKDRRVELALLKPTK